MIIYLLIGVILTAVLLGFDSINPVGERLIDNVDKGTVLMLVIDVIIWPIIMASIIKDLIKALTK